MNELTKAAKVGKKISEDRYLRKTREVDLAMSEKFCPLICGDCRGVRCSMFDEYQLEEGDGHPCQINNFFFDVKLRLEDLRIAIEKRTE